MTDNHTRLTIFLIATMSVLALAAGTYLIQAGYQTGEQAVLIASAGLSGLVGFLGGRGNSKPQTNITAEPPSNVTVNQPDTTK